jgi:hypothetical protein
MSRDRLTRRCRRLLERLSQPSSAAGLAALLALLIPELAGYAPVLMDLALMVVAIAAAILAMVKCECRACNGR